MAVFSLLFAFVSSVRHSFAASAAAAKCRRAGFKFKRKNGFIS
jgi:hypothetical protein